jgi:hypothetical protein
MTEIREFGTGLREHLEAHGVRLDIRLVRPTNLDLLALAAAEVEPPRTARPTLQPLEAAGAGLLAA